MKLVRLHLMMALGVVATIRAASPLTMTTITGRSMEPTLRPGGTYVLDRGYYRSHNLFPGDIVVFRLHGQTYVKRVHALPGDRVWLLRSNEDDGSGDCVLDLREVTRYQRSRTRSLLPNHQVVALTVAPGYCYVIGDNSLNSIDSRQFGPVPVTSILGRVLE
jgi:signal peptidase I